MQIIIRNGRRALRRHLRPATTRRMFAGLRFFKRRELPVMSPRVRKEVAALYATPPLKREASRAARNVVGKPFGYRARPRPVGWSVPPRTNGAEMVMATRFDVVEASPEFLAFLGKAAPGFHVFELSCAGFES